jgi:threonine-phosphate decarboxylase
MTYRIRRGFAKAETCHHGGKIRKIASRLGTDEELLDFSANINPLGSPPLEEIVRQELKWISHYPDNEYHEFKQAAADFVEVSSKNIVPGNGSSEIIRLFVEMVIEAGDIVVIPSPTFGEYEAQSKLFGAEIVYVDQINKSPAIGDSILKDARAVFICNPNNPTGRLIHRVDLKDLARRCEHNETFLLVDEAFIELSDPDQSLATLAPEMNYLFVMRSLTKSFGVPGIRLGFGVANETIASVMDQVRIPWSISSIGAAIGAYLLGETEHIELSRKYIKGELSWLTRALQGLGLEPLESSVNFILVNIKSTGQSSGEITKRMQGEGILVRDCSSFVGLGTDYIRVAVRNRNENALLVAALERVLGCAD